jgi:hypothetical protein
VTMADVMSIDTGSDLGSSSPARIRSAIDEVDLVVGIFSDATSGSVTRELSMARDESVDVLAIVVGERAKVPVWLAQTSFRQVGQPCRSD